jgi:hypothetical protein
MACYEARRKKEEKPLEMEEMKFLMIDASLTTDTEKAAIIRKRQAKIMKKFRNLDDDSD